MNNITQILIDGPDQILYQWDRGQRLLLQGGEAGTRVDFARPGQSKAVSAYAYAENGSVFCDIPDTLLAEAGHLWVYVYESSGSRGETARSILLPVIFRPEPEDHVAQEDVRTWHQLENRIREAEAAISAMGGSVSIFAGKTASFYGDSLTEQNSHYTKGYHKWVSEILGLARYRNYGVSGYKITDVLNKVKSVSDDADLIFVMAGVNDVQFGVPLGTLNGLESGTVYGNLDLLCTALREKYPQKLLVFLTPAEQAKYPGTAGVSMHDVAAAVREVCRKHSVVVYDNYVYSGIHTANLSWWTTDSCHWNDQAHEMTGRNLAHFVMNTFHCIPGAAEENGAVDNSEYIGKLFRMKGYHNGQFNLTALVEVDEDFAAGNAVQLSLAGRNAVNMVSKIAGGAQLFGDESGECANSSFTGTFSTGKQVFSTVDSDGNVTMDAEYVFESDPATKYLKVIGFLGAASTADPASFVIDRISVTVNGTEKEILEIGGFFADEPSELVDVEENEPDGSDWPLLVIHESVSSADYRNGTLTVEGLTQTFGGVLFDGAKELEIRADKNSFAQAASVGWLLVRDGSVFHGIGMNNSLNTEQYDFTEDLTGASAVSIAANRWPSAGTVTLKIESGTANLYFNDVLVHSVTGDALGYAVSDMKPMKLYGVEIA